MPEALFFLIPNHFLYQNEISQNSQCQKSELFEAHIFCNYCCCLNLFDSLIAIPHFQSNAMINDIDLMCHVCLLNLDLLLSLEQNQSLNHQSYTNKLSLQKPGY
ncbi:hypothetical protein BpHYR1_025397 [Brachionus plicatilis]|uniref:Uncharacterized protein n=1 Tax=Brachionus plicatilis TaxID=10195 RepID=A0A3M7RH20_BRAPC|nr:hypothetical protein BpHYR1_025397 [Brachionus plicatilis]